jgi:hypothetical protein
MGIDLTRIILQPAGKTTNNNVPNWLDTTAVIAVSKSSLDLQNDMMQKIASQDHPMTIVSYLCGTCKKTYYVNHPKLVVQANLATRAGNQVQYVCPECSFELTPYSSTIKMAEAPTHKYEGLIEKRSNLQAESSGTIDTYVDRHIVFKALEAMKSYASKLGMSMANPRYINAVHKTEAGQQYPILNDINCEIDWVYGRKQTGRAFATISIDQAGTFKFPKVFKVADGREYPFEKEYVEALEKEGGFSHPHPLKYRKTDTMVRTNPGIWNFKQANLVNDPDSEASMDNAIMQVIADAGSGNAMPTPPQTFSTPPPAPPQQNQQLQPNQSVTNPADGKQYTVVSTDPQKGATVADPQTGVQSVVPTNQIQNLKPTVKTQASFQIQSMVDQLVDECLHKNVKGEGEEVNQLGQTEGVPSQMASLIKSASHVSTMSTDWKTQREHLLTTHKENKKIPQVFAYKGYTPLNNNPTEHGHDDVNNIPVGEDKKVSIGLNEFPKGEDRDQSIGVGSEKGYDIPFKEMDNNQVKDREYFHNMNALPIDNMKREELAGYVKDEEADHNYGMSMETPDKEQVNSLAIMRAMGITKIADEEVSAEIPTKPELIKKPIQYKELKTAPKIKEFQEPPTIPEASGKVKEAVTKLKKAQALIVKSKAELASKIKSLQESIATIQAPYDKAAKKEKAMVTSYLEMAFDQLTKTQDHIAAYDESILTAIERQESELSSQVTLPQLLAKADELEPAVAEGIRKLSELLAQERTREVLERLLIQYPKSKVQEKKIVSSIESQDVDWFVDELDDITEEFASLNEHLEGDFEEEE